MVVRRVAVVVVDSAWRGYKREYPAGHLQVEVNTGQIKVTEMYCRVQMIVFSKSLKLTLHNNKFTLEKILFYKRKAILINIIY